MQLPPFCGPVSEAVVRVLRVSDDPTDDRTTAARLNPVADPLTDRDFQLALWLLYELHYRGFDDVPADLEWDPLLINARRLLEERFEAALRELAAPLLEEHGADPGGSPEDVADETVRRLVALTSGGESSLARHLGKDATREEYLDFLSERAVYHLRESDPQSFVLPRIGGAPKVALAELQFDEYGAGRPDRLHAELFARALRSLGLTDDLGEHLATASASTLAVSNAMSLFALNRRLRGASLGHLAAFEATSSLPCRLVARGARRLGLPGEVADYYDEHVEADAVHEQLAIREICGALVRQEPQVAGDVLLGAATCLELDRMAAEELLARWGAADAAPRAAAPDRPGVPA